jgi:hypothetical protein
LDDIDTEADVRFVGSRHAMSRHQQFQQMSQILNVLSTNPQVAQFYPDLLVRMFRDGMDVKDAEAVVAQAQQALQQAQEQAAQQAQLTGQTPPNSPNIGMNQPGGNVSREGVALA